MVIIWEASPLKSYQNSISLNNIVERIIDDSVWLVLTNNYSWPK